VAVTWILYDRRQVLEKPEEVLAFFRRWGIRYAVVESPYTREGLEPALAALESGEFELVRRFPLHTDIPRHLNKEIHLYRLRGELHRATEPVVVPMMTIRHNIRVRLDKLAGQPWPN
jgi:hypothetical protein